MFIAPRAPIQSPAPKGRNVSDNGPINLHSAPPELPKYWSARIYKHFVPAGLIA
jgi:hypothetical protein